MVKNDRRRQALAWGLIIPIFPQTFAYTLLIDHQLKLMKSSKMLMKKEPMFNLRHEVRN